MPAKMVYEWDNKRDECYNLYITENKSLEEIIAHFRDDKNFTPRYVDSCTHTRRSFCATCFLSLHFSYLVASSSC